MFDEEIQAWSNGPVSPALYDRHRGDFLINLEKFKDEEDISNVDKENIDIVIAHYSKYNGQQLSEITHEEAPWLNARGDLPIEIRGNRTILQESMSEYYSSLK